MRSPSLGMAAVAGVVCVALAPTPALSYPIPPLTLWDLAARSRMIVVGRVTRVCRWDSAAWEQGRRDAATLEVLETWKGTPREQVEVRISSEGMICPAPELYLEDGTVVAFLERDPDGDWMTCGLSYGTLYPTTDELNVIRELVKKALAPPALGVTDREAKLEWCVAAARRRATRWHGLYELYPGSDGYRVAYDPEGQEVAEPVLDPGHVEAIARGFVDEPPEGDPTFPMTLVMLRGRRDRKVDATTVAILDRILEGDRLPAWTDRAMALVLARLGRPETTLATIEVEGPRVRGRDPGASARLDAELRRTWAEVRPEVDVDPVVLPQPGTRSWLPVGEFTSF